jgi:hypothetical protein
MNHADDIVSALAGDTDKLNLLVLKALLLSHIGVAGAGMSLESSVCHNVTADVSHVLCLGSADECLCLLEICNSKSNCVGYSLEKKIYVVIIGLEEYLTYNGTRVSMCAVKKHCVGIDAELLTDASAERIGVALCKLENVERNHSGCLLTIRENYSCRIKRVKHAVCVSGLPESVNGNAKRGCYFKS